MFLGIKETIQTLQCVHKGAPVLTHIHTRSHVGVQSALSFSLTPQQSARAFPDGLVHYELLQERKHIPDAPIPSPWKTDGDAHG